MTVPEGTPANVRMADEMAQQLQILGADLDTLTTLTPGGQGGAELLELLQRMQGALNRLDVVRVELVAAPPEDERELPIQSGELRGPGVGESRPAPEEFKSGGPQQYGTK